MKHQRLVEQQSLGVGLMMWGGGFLGFVVRILMKLRKNRELGIGYDHRSQPKSWLTAWID